MPKDTAKSERKVKLVGTPAWLRAKRVLKALGAPATDIKPSNLPAITT
jgi:hypothetical protein